MRTLILICFLAGCVPAVDPAAPAPRSATSIRSTGVATWGESTYPADAFLRDGAPAVPDGFPNPRAEEPLFARVGELLSQRSGFCTSCNVVFHVDGELDASTVAANIEFVDLVSGDTIGADVEYLRAEGTLTARPERRHVLLPNHPYAALVDSEVRGADGLPVRLPEGVDDLGFGADLAAITRFETDDPAADLRAVRAAIRSRPAPSIQVDRIFEAASLDELLGIGDDVPPGLERPASDEGFAMRHETTMMVVTGTLVAPRFVDGEAPDVGLVQRNESGEPIIVGEEPVPYLLIIPKAADLANLPVVVAHHGFNASRITALTLADTAGEAGWAVLAIDAYQHGERAAIASDRRNQMRDVDQPDGFAETNKLDIVARVFGFSGVPQDYVLAPDYALSAFTQFAADALSTIHFVHSGDATALQNVAGLGSLRFDADRVVYLGNSMGAVVGMSVIAVEHELAGAVLNVLPGSIMETLAESGEFRPLVERVFLPLLGVEHTFDEKERSMLFDPTVDLFRWVLEPVDPLALASSRVVANVLVQLAGHDEVAAPRPSDSVVQAAQFEQVTMYPQAMHGMMEVETQVSRFAEPLIPPLTSREPRAVRNPTQAVHDEITAFLRATRTE